MISIAIPSSSLVNENDEKIKTYKLGVIARASVVFRVDEILIYRDPKLDETSFIVEVLEYINTPQYLRKYIYPLKSELRYAGVLPPLRIPSHRAKHLKTGEVREGVVRKVGPDDKAWVDIGINALALLPETSKGVKEGARLTVRVSSKKPLLVEEALPNEYWGYKVKEAELEQLLNKGAVITSRGCDVPEGEKIRKEVSRSLILVFGNPEEGVSEIAKRIGLKINNECWNMVPDQGTETVRLEEAIIASLSVVNYVIKSR